uniref:Uncharacterized protein n=1 Tax=Avena sativa TaxID=4498 RepID=A0ACD5VJU9_AVESA
MRRIRSKFFKIKGVEQVCMDLPKNQVTLVGTMDAKALPEKLRKKLRRPMDVVPAGKDKDKDKEGKQQQQQGYSKEGCNKDGKQQGDGKQSKEAVEKAIATELELWKTAYYDSQGLQATQFLPSDENPNACSVMGLVLLIAVVFWGAGVWNRFMRVTETTCGAPIQSAPPVHASH